MSNREKNCHSFVTLLISWEYWSLTIAKLSSDFKRYNCLLSYILFCLSHLGLIHDQTGSYDLAFVMMGCVSTTALVVLVAESLLLKQKSATSWRKSEAWDAIRGCVFDLRLEERPGLVGDTKQREDSLLGRLTCAPALLDILSLASCCQFNSWATSGWVSIKVTHIF